MQRWLMGTNKRQKHGPATLGRILTGPCVLRLIAKFQNFLVTPNWKMRPSVKPWPFVGL